MPNKVVCLAGFCLCVPKVAGVCQSSRLLAEVELLEFLLRLAEVLFVSVDRALPLSLSPFFWEKVVEALLGIGRAEVFFLAVRRVGSGFPGCFGGPAMASCTVARSPDRVFVMPLFSSSGGMLGLLGLLLLLFDPVRDLGLLLLYSRSSDICDEEVFGVVCCASTSDLSVMSSILGALSVGPCQSVHIDEMFAFHLVRGVS